MTSLYVIRLCDYKGLSICDVKKQNKNIEDVKKEP